MFSAVVWVAKSIHSFVREQKKTKAHVICKPMTTAQGSYLLALWCLGHPRPSPFTHTINISVRWIRLWTVLQLIYPRENCQLTLGYLLYLSHSSLASKSVHHKSKSHPLNRSFSLDRDKKGTLFTEVRRLSEEEGSAWQTSHRMMVLQINLRWEMLTHFDDARAQIGYTTCRNALVVM